MKIIYHGYNCFSIESKLATIVTDPYKSDSLTIPNLSADIVTVSHNKSKNGNTSNIGGEPLVLDIPGEYERKEVLCMGIDASHQKKDKKKKNTIFVFVVEGKTICHLGGLTEMVSSEELEKIGEIDILMVPVGGESVLDSKKALEIVDEIEPRIVIPMSYKLPGIEEDFAEVDQFKEIMGKKDIEEVEKLELGKSKLPQESTNLYVLNAVHS